MSASLPARLAAATGLILAVSAAPGLVHAGKPKVLVLPYQPMGKGVQPELAEQTTGVIAQELSESGIEVVRSDSVAEVAAARAKPDKGGKDGGKDAPTGDAAAGDKAQELISRAKLALEDSEFAAAIKQLKTAVKQLEDNGDAVADLRLLPEAYLWLAVAYFRDGNEDDANEAMSKAIHFAPDKKLEETEFPPIFIRAYDRVRYNVLGRPRARVEIKAAPGASVLFDGRNLGKAPLVLAEALPGNHWVRIERAGEPVQVKKVQLRGKKTILLEFAGGEAGAAEAPSEDAAVGVLGAISKNEVSKSHVDQLQNAGRRAGADFVMFGAMYKTETAFNIYTLMLEVSDGTVGRLVDIAFDLDMLSAQIEVYKVAEDAKKQVEAKKLERVEQAPTFAIAPKINLHQKKSKQVAAKEETKIATVLAAPPPTAAPSAPKIAAGSGEGGSERGPVASAGGSGRSGGSGDEDEPEVVKAQPARAQLVPKDEEGEGAPSVASVAAAPQLAPTTAVIPVDEDEDKGGGTGWWVWALIGVAAVGAAGAGGFFLLSNKTPEEGTLRITWQ